MKLGCVLYCCIVAVSSGASAQAPNVNRFKDPTGITADPTGLRRDTSVRVHPRYPRGLEEKAITGAPVVAYVIDTTGRVELETASFVRSSRPEFIKAVCEMLPQFRFQPFLIGDQKWRVLLVESFAFNNWPEADSSAATLAARSQENFSTRPIATVVKELEPLPHCDSPSAAVGIATRECYALAYSDPVQGATSRLFPTWIELSPGSDSGAVAARAQAAVDPREWQAITAYRSWKTLPPDSIAVSFSGHYESIRLDLHHSDSGIGGRAIYLSDIVSSASPPSMRVIGTRQPC